MAEHALITRMPHLPEQLIYASLFHNVQNSAFLRQQLVDCNTDFEYAFLDAASILSINHVLAACFRAMNDAAHSRLRSRNVHSEIVFALNPSNNIAESFRRFGVIDSTTSLIAIKIINISPPSYPHSSSPETAALANHLASSVQGTPLPFTDASLASLHDEARIRKIYKAPLAGPAKGTEARMNGVLTCEARRRELEAVVLGSMAIKGS